MKLLSCLLSFLFYFSLSILSAMFMLRLCCRYSNLSESFFNGQEVSDDVISNEPGIAADRMAMIHSMVTKGYTVKLAKVTHDLVPENATELAIQAGDVAESGRPAERSC